MRDEAALKIDNLGHRAGGVEACAHALKTTEVLTTHYNDFAQAASAYNCASEPSGCMITQLLAEKNFEIKHKDFFCVENVVIPAIINESENDQRFIYSLHSRVQVLCDVFAGDKQEAFQLNAEKQTMSSWHKTCATSRQRSGGANVNARWRCAENRTPGPPKRRFREMFSLALLCLA